MVTNQESVLLVCKGIIAESERKARLLKEYQEEQSWLALTGPNIAPFSGSALLIDLQNQLSACYKQERVNLKRLNKALGRALKHYTSKNVITTDYPWK